MCGARSIARVAALAGLILAPVAADAAPAWRGSAGGAGAYENGQALVELACRGGGLQLSALSPGAGGRHASLVLEVDGTAFLLEAAAAGPGRLSATIPAARAGLVVSALRKGKVAELRVPAGRYRVPLTGSGAALAPLAAACAPSPSGG